jgi:hypothetical protein
MVLAIVVLLHSRLLGQAQVRLRFTKRSLNRCESEFYSVVGQTGAPLLVLDDHLVCQEASPAAARLLGSTPEQLVGWSLNRSSTGIANIDLPDGNSWQGHIELQAADGARIATESISSLRLPSGRHLLMLRDTAAEPRGADRMSRSLALARSRMLEARALRTTVESLAHCVQMNPALDHVLEAAATLVPYDAAQVLLLESPGRLFLAREMCRESGHDRQTACPETIDPRVFPALMRALNVRGGVLVSDTRLESVWRSITDSDSGGSWIGVPLYTGEEVVGLLSFAHDTPSGFNAEHLRLAATLSLPAALAIRTARLQEEAEIYRTELERRLSGSSPL